MLEIVNVSKVYEHGNIKALNKINLNFDEGKIYGIIGYSGAGKSTLIRCMNLLERPTKGSVIFESDDLTKLEIKELRKRRKEITMIFQNFNLFPSLTVKGNISLPLKKTKLSKDEIDKKVDELLEQVDMLEYKNAYPNQLSGGQKQRVAIARALSVDPKLLLCDEATSALDPTSTKSILKLLKKLNKELGITIILITHEMGVIQEICDEVVFLENGNVVFDGNIIDFFKNEDMLKFVGSHSNLSDIDKILPFLDIEKNELLWQLNYEDSKVSLPYISNISCDFDILVNVILADIKLIKGIPLGGVIAKVKGEKKKLLQAKKYLESEGVIVKEWGDNSEYN